MRKKRLHELRQLAESCHHTDTTELDYEKTAVIEELLAEVERLGSSRTLADESAE